MGAEHETVGPASSDGTTDVSCEPDGTSLVYHDLVSTTDSGITGNTIGVNPAMLGSGHLVANTIDTGTTQTPPRKQKVGPKIAPRKDSRNEKHKRIFQACTRCRDRKAKCDGVRPVCSACRDRGAECVFASRRMRGPSKKRLLEDAEFTARRQRGAAGITVPKQQIPSYSPLAIEKSAMMFRGPFAFPSPPHFTFHALHPLPVSPSPRVGGGENSSPATETANNHPGSPQQPCQIPADGGVHLDAYQPNMQRMPFRRSVALSSAPPYDMSAPSTQMPALLGHGTRSAAEANESANCASGNGDGDDSEPKKHYQPSSEGAIQFVQFVPSTDDQLLANGETLQSVITRVEFNGMMETYITSLERKNREKALVSLARYNDILQVLEDEDEAATRISLNIVKYRNNVRAETIPIPSVQDIIEATSTSSSPSHTPAPGNSCAAGSPLLPNASPIISDQLGVPNAANIDDGSFRRKRTEQNPQFRSWAMKNFALQRIGNVNVVTRGGRVVAVQEQLYDILVYCHRQTNHGGRDKTKALVSKYYSYVPKVFIESFVKACPGCPRKLAGVKRVVKRSHLARAQRDTSGVQPHNNMVPTSNGREAYT